MAIEITGVRVVDEDTVALDVEFDWAGTKVPIEVKLTVEELRDPVKVGIRVLEVVERTKAYLLADLAQRFVGYVIEEVEEGARL